MNDKILVVNRHHYDSNQYNESHIPIYIGRGTIFGNKFVIGKDGDREEVVEKYKQDLRNAWKNNEKIKFEILKLVKYVKDGYILVFICSCKPKLCHGDVLKYVIETLISKGY